jgi:hypothetical protein
VVVAGKVNTRGCEPEQLVPTVSENLAVPFAVTADGDVHPPLASVGAVADAAVEVSFIAPATFTFAPMNTLLTTPNPPAVFKLPVVVEVLSVVSVTETFSSDHSPFTTDAFTLPFKAKNSEPPDTTLSVVELTVAFRAALALDNASVLDPIPDTPLAVFPAIQPALSPAPTPSPEIISCLAAYLDTTTSVPSVIKLPVGLNVRFALHGVAALYSTAAEVVQGAVIRLATTAGSEVARRL